MQKKCSACSILKDLEHYYKHNSYEDGLEKRCIECHKSKKLTVREIIIDGNKACNFCNKLKPIKDFYKNSKCNTHRKECKKCTNVKRLKSKPCLDKTFDEIHEDVQNKKCNKCKIVKESLKFCIDRNNKDGLENICKACKSQNKDGTFINKICKNCKIEKPIEAFKSNTAQVKNCMVCIKILKKERQRKYIRKCLSSDPILKLKHLTRNLIYQSFKRACNETYVKSEKSEEILGCTFEEFFIYLESLFTEGMTFENHGACRNGSCEGVWHIDHIIPLNSAKTEDDIIELCHYTNLQPLWAFDNISKGKKNNSDLIRISNINILHL